MARDARAGGRHAQADPRRPGDPGVVRPVADRGGVPRARAGARCRIPAEYELAPATARRIELAFLADPLELRPCHNDLLPANFIDDGERIRIVDWEYAGMGDPFFDLGNFSINHELTSDEDAAAARGLRRRAAAPAATGAADAHAGRVGLPRGDVGRAPAGHQHPRRRLPSRMPASTSSGCSTNAPRHASSARCARPRATDRGARLRVRYRSDAGGLDLETVARRTR